MMLRAEYRGTNENEELKEVFNVVKEAFTTEETDNPEEPLLVDKLRKSDAFIPELPELKQTAEILTSI